MTSRRAQKVAEAIREVTAMAILADLKDPRIQNVTVTRVSVAGDLRTAKVHVSVMGSEAQQSLCLRGLQNAAGFLQKKCGNRIDTRFTPRIEFVLDEGVKKSLEIAQILKEVLPDSPVTGAAAVDDDDAEEAGDWDEADDSEADDEEVDESPVEEDGEDEDK